MVVCTTIFVEKPGYTGSVNKFMMLVNVLHLFLCDMKHMKNMFIGQSGRAVILMSNVVEVSLCFCLL